MCYHEPLCSTWNSLILIFQRGPKPKLSSCEAPRATIWLIDQMIAIRIPANDDDRGETGHENTPRRHEDTKKSHEGTKTRRRATKTRRHRRERRNRRGPDRRTRTPRKHATKTRRHEEETTTNARLNGRDRGARREQPRRHEARRSEPRRHEDTKKTTTINAAHAETAEKHSTTHNHEGTKKSHEGTKTRRRVSKRPRKHESTKKTKATYHEVENNERRTMSTSHRARSTQHV